MRSTSPVFTHCICPLKSLACADTYTGVLIVCPQPDSSPAWLLRLRIVELTLDHEAPYFTNMRRRNSRKDSDLTGVVDLRYTGGARLLLMLELGGFVASAMGLWRCGLRDQALVWYLQRTVTCGACLLLVLKLGA